VGGDERHTKIAQPRPSLRHERLLGLAKNAQTPGFDFGHDERRAMTKDMVVTQSASRIYEEQCV
jgi:hypothetical protein